MFQISKRHSLMALAIAMFATRAHAQEKEYHHPLLPVHPHLDKTPPPGPPRFIPHTYKRAGWPFCLGEHAAPTNNEKYCGHYVGGGGGGLFHVEEPRRCDEGVWGWDYVGTHPVRKVFRGWNHGRLYQGGIGSYPTDGPCDPPDVIAGFTGRFRRRGSSE